MAEAEIKNTPDGKPQCPSLWDPNAIWKWSILLTPIFGMTLVSKNWKSLGEAKKADKFFWWVVFITSVPFQLLIKHSINTPIFMLTYACIYLGWYFYFMRPQAKHVKETFGDSYTKRDLKKPLGIVFAAIIGLAIMDYKSEYRQRERVVSKLIVAVNENDIKAAQQIIKENTPNKIVGNTPKILALRKVAMRDDRREILALLLDNGFANGEDYYTLLSLIKKKQWETAMLLLNHGVDPTDPTDTDSEKTPLRLALKDKRMDVADLLLKKGAGGKWALLDAVADEDYETVRFLLNNGVDVNLNFNHGVSPLTMSIITGKKLETIKLLLAYKADIDKPDAQGNIPRGLAFATGRDELIHLFQNPPENVQIEKETVTIPKTAIASESEKPLNKLNEELSLAAGNGQVDRVKQLLDRGADANTIDPDMRAINTPLMHAAAMGHTEIVKLLLAKGADINANSEAGFTALMLAAGNGRVEAVKLLIAAGADINAESKSGRTVLKYAEAGTHPDAQLVLQILRSNGAR